MKRISLRLYRVRIRSCQKGFSFDRFIQRGVVLLVLVLVWLVLQVGLLLVWVRVSCCDVASWLHWVLPQCLVLRGAVLLVLLLVCVLALLGPSSASLYSCSDSVVSGSDSESRNVPCRGTVVSGARNVPCLDRAVIRSGLKFDECCNTTVCCSG